MKLVLAEKPSVAMSLLKVICATDAGREGELILRLVYHQCSCKKPV